MHASLGKPDGHVCSLSRTGETGLEPAPVSKWRICKSCHHDYKWYYHHFHSRCCCSCHYAYDAEAAVSEASSTMEVDVMASGADSEVPATSESADAATGMVLTARDILLQ